MILVRIYQRYCFILTILAEDCWWLVVKILIIFAVQMQSSGPAQDLGPAVLFAEPELGAPGSCRAWGKRSQCIMHWALCGVWKMLTGLDAEPTRFFCGAGLGSGLTLGEFFASLMYTYTHTYTHTHTYASDAYIVYCQINSEVVI